MKETPVSAQRPKRRSPASRASGLLPGHWLLQDAKARFSERVRLVRSEGPQHVTVPWPRRSRGSVCGRVSPPQRRAGRRSADRRDAGKWRLLVEEGRKSGHTFSQPDLSIAATALCHGLTILSRDTSGYVRAPVTVVDPWG